MLSRLDDIIYPNRCEVIEIEASHRYIYPIYKNGSSSITEYASQQGYKILINQQITKLDTIDVIIRNPLDRFISGIRTFVHNTKRDNPTLDVPTILYFAENYLFLNRHYAPQIAWLVNLSKYSNAKLRLVGMSALPNYTSLNIQPPENIFFDDSTKERLSKNIHNELYLRLDNYLLELIGNELTFVEILDYIKNKDPVAYAKMS